MPPAGDPRAVELYCPAGIGAHRDHVSTLLAVSEAYEKLRGRCTLHLYEDLHYASVPQARAGGLERAAKVFSGMELSPTVHDLSEKKQPEKCSWLASMPASMPPPAAGKFIPASNLVKSMHEIVWNVEN